MTAEQSVAEFRAPVRDGDCLQHPPLPEVEKIWSENQRLFKGSSVQVGDRSLEELRSNAQSELISLSQHYTSQHCESSFAVERDNVILLTGHQPELFHPGVWYKNFALSSLGKQLNCIPIHLNIDTEVCRSVSIKVPDSTTVPPSIVECPFDSSSSDMPYELTFVKDEAVFQSFARRIEQLTSKAGITNPIIDLLWKLESRRDDFSVGQRIATARHRLEHQYGIQSLELNLSNIVSTRSFAEFAAAILVDLDRFVDCYNSALDSYRETNHLRSKTHPAPNLTIDEKRYETPLWVYDHEHPRQALRVEFVGEAIEIHSLGNRNWRCKANVSEIADLICDMNRKGCLIRPRGLLTTMYARLILCDCFLHGIGGAKYDRVTDDIMRNWLNIQPPAFGTLTATFQLPLSKSNVTQEDLAQLEAKIRDARYHPERLIDPENASSEALNLVAEKRELFQQKVAKGEGKQRRERISQINQALHEIVADRVEEFVNQVDKVRHQLETRNILESREYSFCLFPEKLVDDLKSISEVN